MTEAPQRIRRRSGYETAFWTIAAGFAIAMAYTTAPTPLYALYQSRDGFPTWVVTIVFAAYAVGVALSLSAAGHLSDRAGRRPVLLVALALEVVSAAMFVAWNDVTGLVVARLVSGVAIGMLAPTASAYLIELRARGRPGSADAPTVASFANLGGLSLGPLVAGVLVTVAPRPLATTYALFAALLLVVAACVLAAPETVHVGAAPSERTSRRPALPTAARAAFWAAGAGTLAGFAVFGLFMALTPAVLATLMGVDSHLVAGAVPFAVFMSAALAQAVTARMPPRGQIALAGALLVAGVAGLAVAALVASAPLLALAGVVAGAGGGMLFRSALAVVSRIAPEGQGGRMLAAMYLIAYLSLAVPTLAVGLSLVWLPLQAVLLGFSAIVAVLVAWAAPTMRAGLA